MQKKYFRLVELDPKFRIWAFSAVFALFFWVANLPPHNRRNTCTSLTFPNYEFGKGQYAFCPIKLSSFAEKKNKVHQKYHKIHKRGPLQTESNASQLKFFSSQVKHYFGVNKMVARKTKVSLLWYLLMGWAVWIIVNFIEKTVSA